MTQDWFNDTLLASVKMKWVQEGKRCRALMHLYKMIPDVLNKTPVTAIFAPDAGGLYTQPFHGEVVVYLAPELEIESQEQVNFTVAHEFAHVMLRHSFLCGDSMQAQSDEQAADALAKEWGFQRPSEPYTLLKQLQILLQSLFLRLHDHPRAHYSVLQSCFYAELQSIVAELVQERTEGRASVEALQSFDRILSTKHFATTLFGEHS